MRVRVEGSMLKVELVLLVPIVSMTNITFNIPVINYHDVIPSSFNMALSYSINLDLLPGTPIDVEIFASNEYGDGKSVHAFTRTSGKEESRDDYTYLICIKALLLLLW